ncbi:MAG: GlcG/HbpS family heme-binding protein [Casimicrobiaceae bacterium]
MIQRPALTAADAERIIRAAEAEATKNGWAVTIAICDDGGHLLCLKRLDGAPPVSATIAPRKAITSAIGRRESGAYEKMVNEGRVSFLSVDAVTPLEGGAPIVVDGCCVGAIGVSGVKSSEDLQIARAGIAALESSCD